MITINQIKHKTHTYKQNNTMRNYNHTKGLNLKLVISNEDDVQVKAYTISLDDYIEETIGKKCQNVADNLISNMIKHINLETKITQ